MNQMLTIGELAKQVNVTVRTLQYYDRIGLMKPKALTEGGRRLYDSSDIGLLHQIITLKSLGLSLDDIKMKLIPMESNQHIVQMLKGQASMIDEQISKSKRTLESIHMMMDEIEQTDQVDWSKYANMVKMIQENNEYYWILNYLEADDLSIIEAVHKYYGSDELSPDWLMSCLKKAIELDQSGHRPDSEEAQALAAEWWSIIQKYTKGNEDMFDRLYEFYSQAGKWPEDIREIQKKSKVFLERSIEIYLKKHHIQIGEHNKLNP